MLRWSQYNHSKCPWLGYNESLEEVDGEGHINMDKPDLARMWMANERHHDRLYGDPSFLCTIVYFAHLMLNLKLDISIFAVCFASAQCSNVCIFCYVWWTREILSIEVIDGEHISNWWKGPGRISGDVFDNDEPSSWCSSTLRKQEVFSFQWMYHTQHIAGAFHWFHEFLRYTSTLSTPANKIPIILTTNKEASSLGMVHSPGRKKLCCHYAKNGVLGVQY